ncbi:hypothetical protein [Streptomyces sp. NPDC007369]
MRLPEEPPADHQPAKVYPCGAGLLVGFSSVGAGAHTVIAGATLVE